MGRPRRTVGQSVVFTTSDAYPVRWLYYNPLDVEEVEFRSQMTAGFHVFWQSFGEKVSVLESALGGGTAWDWHHWLNGLLASVDRRLHWEIVPDERAGHWRLAITVQSERALRPMLREFLSAAPEIPGWSFHQWLPPLPYSLARRWARQRGGSDCDHLAVKVLPGANRQLDLRFTPAPDAPPASPQTWLTVAYTACEALLGEKVFDQFIGSIAMAEPEEGRRWWRRLRQSSPREEALPLSDLPAAVDKHLSDLREQLPAAPYARLIDSCGWTTLEMEPAGEAQETRRHDLRLLTASVIALPLLRAAHEQRRFCSALHSRHGETFCYVQWRHGATSDTDLLSRREQLDKAIAAAMKQCGAACVIGGGIGEKYLYFDLAVSDLQAAIAPLRRTLLAHDPGEQCWLRFFDDELAAEWVGIHPAAAAPPGIG